MLPAAVKAGLVAHLERVREQHRADLRHGAGWVELPGALMCKYPNAGRDWGWQWTPGHALLRGSRHRPAAPPPPPRIRAPAGREGCGPWRRDCQAGHVPYLPSLVCHPPAGGEPRHPYRPGVARAPGRQHDDDLHPRSQSGPGWGPEPGRPDVPVMGLGRDEHQTTESCVISSGASRYITAHGPGGVLQRGARSGVSRAPSDSFAVIYRTTQSDNAVQDTGR